MSRQSTLMPSIILATLAISPSFPAAAQETSAQGTPPSDWHYSVGGGPMVMPNYEGSKHYTVTGLPMLDVTWRDMVNLSAAEGLKVTLKPLADDGFFVTGGVGYWLGRKEGVDKHHGDTLRGLGNLSGGAVGKLGTGYQWGALRLGLDLARDIDNGRDGTTATPYASYKIVQGRRFDLSGKVSASWADDNYMNNIFGVTPTQAANSLKHYTPFKAEAGLKDVKFGLAADYRITRSISVFAMADLAHLMGDAADSPIVKTQGSREQLSASIGLVYRF